jgi:hypothetical protein
MEKAGIFMPAEEKKTWLAGWFSIAGSEFENPFFFVADSALVRRAR